MSLLGPTISDLVVCRNASTLAQKVNAPWTLSTMWKEHSSVDIDFSNSSSAGNLHFLQQHSLRLVQGASSKHCPCQRIKFFCLIVQPPTAQKFPSRTSHFPMQWGLINKSLSETKTTVTDSKILTGSVLQELANIIISPREPSVIRWICGNDACIESIGQLGCVVDIKEGRFVSCSLSDSRALKPAPFQVSVSSPVVTTQDSGRLTWVAWFDYFGICPNTCFFGGGSWMFGLLELSSLSCLKTAWVIHLLCWCW